jgi:hypothetical protein
VNHPAEDPAITPGLLISEGVGGWPRLGGTGDPWLYRSLWMSQSKTNTRMSGSIGITPFPLVPDLLGGFGETIGESLEVHR